MGGDFSTIMLVVSVIWWRNKEYHELKELKKDDEELSNMELLEYIRNVELRNIFLFLGVLIMIMGVR